MNQFIELIRDLIDTSKERIKNPFVGSYVIAFCIVNWKSIFLLFFSNGSIEYKLCVIQIEYSVWDLLYPIIISLVYVIGLPWLNNLLDCLTKKAKDIKRRKQNLLNIKSLRQKKTEAELENKIAQTKAQTIELSELKEKILKLENESRSFESERNSLKSEREHFKTTETLLSLLIDQNDNAIAIENYIKSNGLYVDSHKSFFESHNQFKADELGVSLYMLMKKAKFITEDNNNVGQLSETGFKFVGISQTPPF